MSWSLLDSSWLILSPLGLNLSGTGFECVEMDIASSGHCSCPCIDPAAMISCTHLWDEASFIRCECSFCGPETPAPLLPELRDEASYGGSRRCTVRVHPSRYLTASERGVPGPPIVLCGQCENHYVASREQPTAIKKRRESGMGDDKSSDQDDEASKQALKSRRRTA